MHASGAPKAQARYATYLLLDSYVNVIPHCQLHFICSMYRPPICHLQFLVNLLAILPSAVSKGHSYMQSVYCGELWQSIEVGLYVPCLQAAGFRSPMQMHFEALHPQVLTVKVLQQLLAEAGTSLCRH